MIGNDDEIDTNICISFMLQDNPMKCSGQGVSDICHPNNYQSAEKVVRKVISNEFSKPPPNAQYVVSNEFSKPHQTLVTSRICLFYSSDLLFLNIFNDLLT